MVESLKEALVLDLINIRKDMIELVGGKGANLGELVSFGIRVPPGFVITSKSFKYFIEYNGLKSKIADALSSSSDSFEASDRIKSLIMESKMPEDLGQSIMSSFDELRRNVGKDILVAVRSSATAEDIAEASFAGQQDTYLNVDREHLLENVKKVWASLYTARAIEYRKSKSIDTLSVSMAVVVQKMVNSRTSGVMFTLHPATGENDVVVIEGSWGLGEAIVGGKVTPDEYVVDKATLKVKERKVSNKTLKIVYDKSTNANKEVKIEGNEAETISFSEEEAVELARLGLKIEDHYKRPMDIEWAIDSDFTFPESVFIVQARPETYWSSRKVEKKPEAEEKNLQTGKVIVKGLPASPGIASGTARVIFDLSDAKGFQKGQILVTRMTDPDWVPIMKIAGAIVTDEGGMTSHASIVSRELGVPAIVGSKDATKLIKDGQEITVDAIRGIVYDGRLLPKEEERPATTATTALSKELLMSLYPVTATKIYMNLGEPTLIDKYQDLPFDGIGLMRIEFIVSEWVKYHPLYLIKTGQSNLFIDKLSEGVAKVAQGIYPRPVVVRFSDFKTNEYRKLQGGEEFEPEERNPMLGWRGVSRYVSKVYEPAFRLEVRAILKAREEMGLKNVWVMFPFVRTTWELKRAISIMEEEGLRRSSDFKVWIMAEVPSVVVLADEFSKMVDGFSVGSNDLTQLTLGVDRDSDLLASMGYYDERDPAVMASIRSLIKTAHRNGATVSICGQAPSNYPEVAEQLVRAGIDSVSVNPDTVVRTRRYIASVEHKIILEESSGTKRKMRH